MACALAINLGCKTAGAAKASLLPPADSVPAKPGWALVWNDEFNGTAVDRSKWDYEVNGDGGGNNELQYYTDRPQNSFVSNGALTIQALQETYLGKQYTSARMRTKFKGDWTYGYFEMRAQLPRGQGLWPAFWMLPTDAAYGGWPRSGEIDIMELLGQDTRKTYGTIHFGAPPVGHQESGGTISLGPDVPSFADGFHLFAVEWDSLGMKWYADGKQYFQTPHGAPFDKRFHVLLNVAVGGNLPGSPNALTRFPQSMIVDYVRVYQRP